MLFEQNKPALGGGAKKVLSGCVLSRSDFCDIFDILRYLQDISVCSQNFRFFRDAITAFPAYSRYFFNHGHFCKILCTTLYKKTFKAKLIPLLLMWIIPLSIALLPSFLPSKLDYIHFGSMYMFGVRDETDAVLLYGVLAAIFVLFFLPIIISMSISVYLIFKLMGQNEESGIKSGIKILRRFCVNIIVIIGRFLWKIGQKMRACQEQVAIGFRKSRKSLSKMTGMITRNNQMDEWEDKPVESSVRSASVGSGVVRKSTPKNLELANISRQQEIKLTSVLITLCFIQIVCVLPTFISAIRVIVHSLNGEMAQRSPDFKPKIWKSIRQGEVICNLFYVSLSIHNFLFYSIRVQSFKETAVNLKNYAFQNTKAYFKPEDNEMIRYTWAYSVF